MRLYEHEAKKLLAKGRVPMPRSGVATHPGEAKRLAAEIGGPVALKSQVLSGGRMKAGGVKFADTPNEAETATSDILELKINGQTPRGILVEAMAPIKQEFYAGVTYNAIDKKPVVIFSDMGGIDIEEVAEKHPDHVGRRSISAIDPLTGFQVKELLRDVGVGSAQLGALTRIITGLVGTFQRYNLTLAEINPLAQLEDGSFSCLDCHIDMEDEARGAHTAILTELGIDKDESRQGRPPTDFELKGAQIDASDPRGVAGRVVEFDGDLGLVIGAGGGSLVLFDAVLNSGGKPANYCEIGGNPSVRKVCELTKLILSKPGVDKIAVMMNVVSNTRVDIVARGVVKGVIESGYEPSEKIAIFRIPGSWENEGFKILDRYGVEYCDRTVPMSEAARRAVAKLGNGA